MKKVSARTIAVGVLLGLSVLLTHCRAEQNAAMTEVMDAGSEDLWYDMDGNGGACVTPPAACANFDYEKVFVDQCLEKSGRAKTCGCTMRCSVKFEYTRLRPPAGSGIQQVSTNPADICTEKERQTVNDIIENRRTGSDEDRCIEDFFCQGTQERCQPAVIPKVSGIRQLAKRGCTAETMNGLCRNGFLDSLQCPDESIKTLTEVLIGQSDKNNPARRCTRNVICFESDVSCDGGQKAAALKYKKLLNKDGCEYWLRKLCTLEN